ncbi:hypothetical protein CH370_00750 [Leptospira kmetyi]|uniref:hypothetical protein n=1 Tax=Leptospira kmetyi TaxID=408139 RepID=UPI000C29D12A|nr:hypothetical protein [Leptospira kmetyi]PJZ43000.1 hypothetical protein CH370_00750 [Leptospira kmetyi]
MIRAFRLARFELKKNGRLSRISVTKLRKPVSSTGFVFLFLSLVLLSCSNLLKNDEERTNILFSEIQIRKERERIHLRFTFYREISEILNGKENKGFGRTPLAVDFPKIDERPMQETETKGIRFYFTEIENIKKEYSISLMRKDGLYKAKFHFDPNDPPTSIRLEFRK